MAELYEMPRNPMRDGSGYCPGSGCPTGGKVTAKEKITEAIREFNWGNYSLDEVEMGLADYPDQQDWVSALADAIGAALDDQPFHTVDLREDGWTLKHPLNCRDRLFSCEYNDALGALDGVPESGPGVYRVSLNGRGWLVIDERVDVPTEGDQQ